MFFGRKDEQKFLTGKNIVIVGTSSAVMFLAAELIDKGADVVFLVDEKKRESYQKKGAFSVKKVLHQTKYCNFRFETELFNKPDCCFVGSEPEDFMRDVLLLVNKQFDNVPVVNLAGFGNENIIKRVFGGKLFRGVFDVFASREKNAITVFSKNPKLEIEIAEEDVVEIKNIVDKIEIDVNVSQDITKYFWQKKVVYVLGNMLMLAYEKKIQDIMKNVEYCEIVRKAAKEWENVLKKQDVELNRKNILPEICAFEQGYKSEFLTQKGVQSLLKMVDFVDKFETPQLFELASIIYKKL